MTEKMNLKISEQAAPNDPLNWQISAISNQGAVELGEKVLVRSPGSRDPGQGTKPVLSGGQLTVGESQLPNGLSWGPLSAHQHQEYLLPSLYVICSFLVHPCPSSPHLNTQAHTWIQVPKEGDFFLMYPQNLEHWQVLYMYLSIE